MDGEGIVWLIAVVWVILSWIMKAVRGAAGQAGSRTGGPADGVDDKPDHHDLRERRARLRAERARRQRLKQAEPSPREDALANFRRELERVMGVHVEDEHGPAGRRATTRLESAEDVEETESLEREPEVVSLETGGERAPRVVVDQDAGAEALVQRRVAAAEARSRPLTRADHQRFDQAIRQPVPTTPSPGPRLRPPLRQAFIWSEVLGKPVSER